MLSITTADNVSHLDAEGAALSGQESELDRYRALLRDANDEPKRLALIQLLINEGARDKFAAKPQTIEPEQLPRPLPFEPALTHPNASSRGAALPAKGEVVGENQVRPGLDDLPPKIAKLTARLESIPPQQPHSESPTPNSANAPSGPPASENVQRPDSGQTNPGSVTNSIATEPLASDDVVSLIANLLSDDAAPAVSAPAGALVSVPTDAAPSDIEKAIASLLRGGLQRPEPSIAPTPGNDEENSIAAQIQDDAAPAVSAPAGALVSVPTDAAPSDIEKAIAGLLRGLQRPEPSIALTPGNDEENSIAAQIQAALENLQLHQNKSRPG
jgi:hypothetical protein